MSLIKVQDLRKSFRQGFLMKSVPVLRGVTFDVFPERITGFIGANGSGKTTTLKCLLGFIRPDSGQFELFGQPGLSVSAKAKIGFLPERPYLQEFLTAHEFLKLHWELSGGGDKFEENCRRVLEKVQLPDVQTKRLRSFSKGMLQRIGVAQAILRMPELIILDEPMSGLDPDGRLMMKDILRELKAQKTAVFFSTHLLADVEELCDNLIIVHQGQLLYQGELSELRKRYPQHTLEQIYRQMVRGVA